jgi:hypothetical protein
MADTTNTEILLLTTPIDWEFKIIGPDGYFKTVPMGDLRAMIIELRVLRERAKTGPAPVTPPAPEIKLKKLSRTERKYQLLKAIATGGKYTKENRVLMPLVANGYLDVKQDKETYKIISATLTDWGRSFVEFEEQQMEKRNAAAAGKRS